MAKIFYSFINSFIFFKMAQVIELFSMEGKDLIVWT